MARLSIILVLTINCLGCISDPACDRQIGLMRSELLDLEDRYALLESQYEAATGTCPAPVLSTESGIKGNAAPASGLHAAPPSDPNNNSIQIPIDPNDLSIRRLHSPAANGGTEHPTDGVQGVVFEPPREARTNRDTQTIRDASVRPAQFVRDHEQSAATNPNPDRLTTNVPTISSDQISGLQVSAKPLMATDDDAAGRVDGVEVSVLPIDGQQAGRWKAGELSIAVIDPAESDPTRQRIGTWRFDASRLFEREINLQGRWPTTPVRLPLTWNYNSPQHSQLRLYARFTPQGEADVENTIPLVLDGGRDAQHVSQELDDELTRTDQSLDSTPSSLPEWSPDR